MSITNAISAIAVVGSIIVTGADYPREHPAARRHRAVRLDDQHRQRLPDHRPDAEDVQDRAQAGRGRPLMMPRCRPARLHHRDGAVRLRAALDEHPGDRPAGRVRRRGRHGAGGRGHLGPARGGAPRLDRACRSWRAFVVGVPLSRVPLTAVPQRTALSHAFGGLAAGLVGTAKYYLWLGEGPENLTPFRMVAIIVEIILGYLTFTGSLMAAGKLQEVKWVPQRPVTYPCRTSPTWRCWAWPSSPASALVLNPTAPWAPVALSGHHRAGAGLRGAADHPDRRGGHADSDRDPQRATPGSPRWRWGSCWTTSC